MALLISMFTNCGGQNFRSVNAADFEQIIKQPDVIVRGENCTHYNRANDERMSNSGFSLTFIMLRPGADLAPKQDDLLSFMKEINWTYQNGERQEVNLIPLLDIYFLDNYKSTFTIGINAGSRSFVALATAMCLVLLAFALLNYVNLTTALCGRRAKEMATRRLLGAGRWRVSLQMIAESTLMCAVAMLLAVLLAEALSPAASRMLDYPFSIFQSITLPRILLAAAFVLLTRTYYRKWHLNTIRKIITRWAPPQDGNNVGRYINFVASRMRHDADATLPPPWQEPERWQDLAWVMAMMENGSYPMEVEPMLKGWDLTP